MKTIEIPGGHATFRDDPSEIRVRQSRLVETASMAAASAFGKLPDFPDLTGDERAAAIQAAIAKKPPNWTQADAEAMLAVQDATIVALLVGWTLPEDLPTMETIQDLQADVYKALEAAAKELSPVAMKALSFEPNPEDGSPTDASSTSGTISKVGGASKSTTKPETPGTSSPTAADTLV